MKRFITIFFVCVIIFAGDVRAEDGKPQESGGTQENVLTIGLIPEQNIFRQVERYTPLAGYLSQKTGLKITLKILTRYGNIIDNFVSTEMDGAFFGSFTYALAHAKIGVEVLARPEAFNGSSTYYGLIFVRKDSGIRGIAQMKGKRFAFVDRATTAGFLLPLAYFKEHGIGDYKSYLKEAYFGGTHECAIYDVLRRKADIGAAKNTVFERMNGADKSIGRNLRIITRSPKVPENGLALRKGIDPAVRDGLREALLNMQNDPSGRTVLKDFGARRFIKTANKDYEPVFWYARQAGLDLARYNYMNE